jgi:hypothetical protein
LQFIFKKASKSGLILQTGSHTAHYYSLTKHAISKMIEATFATVIF